MKPQTKLGSDDTEKLNAMVHGVMSEEIPTSIEGWTLYFGYEVGDMCLFKDDSYAERGLIPIKIWLTKKNDMYNIASTSHTLLNVEKDNPVIMSRIREYVRSMVFEAIHYIIDFRKNLLETQYLAHPENEESSICDENTDNSKAGYDLI